jgi:ribose/xylose/arabinose/galactoside ABC-type transport system permease subunit
MYMRSESSIRRITGSLIRTKELSAVLPLFVLAAIAFFVNPGFLSIGNIFDILRSASFNFILAVPVTFLMCAGGLDLSIGATTALGGVVAAMAQTNGVPLPFAILLGLCSGLAVGTINGILIERLKMPSFITTMAMQYAVNGVIAVITGNNAVTGVSQAFRNIAQIRVGGLSLTVIYAAVIGIIGYVIFNQTKYGREVLAIGGNSETAFLAGINIQSKRTQLYIATSVFAALTGVLYASRFSSAQVNAGSGSELTIIASVIIGGTSMFGGSGTVVGSFLGCILFATIINSLPVMGLSNSWQKVVFGVILAIALFIDQVRIKKIAGK